MVAVCVDQPWGLAPLPDGRSALVGERVTGRILQVTSGQDPTTVATLTGLDSSQSGGLLGIALSPYFREDGLIYAYVTTADDARIVRVAAGLAPQPIVTGLPIGDPSVGGSIAFDDAGMLYATTADGLLRFDAFGQPAGSVGSSPTVAAGFQDPTGICPLPDGGMGVIDHRGADDVLIRATGPDGSPADSAPPLWTFAAGLGGAVDCALTQQELVVTERRGPAVTRIGRTRAGGFAGTPMTSLDGDYGLFHTAVTGPGDTVWLTTANTFAADAAAAGSPATDPGQADDRVLILPSGAGGGGGGLD